MQASPFFLAVRNGHVPIIKELQKHCQIDFGEIDKSGQNALHKVCSGKFVKCLQYILDCGTLDLNAVDKDGNR